MSNRINTLILFHRQTRFGDVEAFVNDYIGDRETVSKHHKPIFQIDLEDGESIRIMPYTGEYFIASIRGCTINKIVFMEEFQMCDVKSILNEIGYIYFSSNPCNQYGIFMGDMELLYEPEIEEEEE